MNKSSKKILNKVEIVLYIMLAVFFSSGKINGIFESQTALSYTLIILSVISIFTSIAMSYMWKKFFDNLRTISILCLFLIFGFKSTIGAIPLIQGNYSPFYFLLILASLIYSTRGVLNSWLISISILILAVHLDSFTSLSLISHNSSVQISIIVAALTSTLFASSYSKRKAIESAAAHHLTEEVVKSRITSSSEGIPTTPFNSIAGDGDASQTTTYALSSEHINKTGKELESVVFFMDKIFRPYSSLAFVFDPKNQIFVLSGAKSKSSHISTKAEIPAGRGVVGELASSLQPFVSGNLTMYSKDLGYYQGNEVVTSILAMPILSRDKELLGALVIDSKNKLAFRDGHRDTIARFAKISAELLVNISMRRKQEQNSSHFSMLFECAQKFAESHQNMEILENLLGYIKRTQDISRVSAVAYMPSENQCRIVKVDSDSNEIVAGYSFTSTTNSILNKAFESGKSQYVTDFQNIRVQNPLFIDGENLNNQIRSVIVVPFTKTGAEYKIAIAIESNQISFFNNEYRHLIATLVNNGASAYEKAVLYQTMQKLATTDGLTQLSNHRNFQDSLHESILHSHRYSRPLSLLLMDIDHFKNFNDTYGHQIGDEVLRKIADALRGSVRTSDLPARYGGEEFVVVLPETDVENGLLMAERIRTTIEKTIIATEQGDLRVTVSVGAATLNVHATTQEQLINCADAAMYQSKKTGRNRSTLYADGMENDIA
jgi:two-component system cell cycle response regulator